MIIELALILIPGALFLIVSYLFYGRPFWYKARDAYPESGKIYEWTQYPGEPPKKQWIEFSQGQGKTINHPLNPRRFYEQ
jgi:hypothetical protein